MTSKALRALTAHVNKQGSSERPAADCSLKQQQRQQQPQQQQPPEKANLLSPAEHLLSVRIPYPGTNTGVSIFGGWLQLNYTVVPYVVRHKLRQTRAQTPTVVQQRWLPLSVLRNAANLLTDVEISPMRATPEESTFLNHCCQRAGVAFTFVKHTKLVTLDAVLALHKKGEVFVHELTAEDLAELQSSNDQGQGGSVAEPPPDASPSPRKITSAATVSSRNRALERQEREPPGASTGDEKGTCQVQRRRSTSPS